MPGSDLHDRGRVHAVRAGRPLGLYPDQLLGQPPGGGEAQHPAGSQGQAHQAHERDPRRHQGHINFKRR